MLQRLNAQARLLLSIGIGLVIFILLPSWLHLPTQILCSWDAGMVSFLAFTWDVMVKATPKAMRRKAQQQDEKRVVILSLIIGAVCAGLLAIGFMLNRGKNASPQILALHVAISVVTIIGSWLLVHTVFALHYAHGYYHDNSTSDTIAGGLEFPDDRQPDIGTFSTFPLSLA